MTDIVDQLDDAVDQRQPIDPERVLQELQAVARGVDRAANELGKTLRLYEGWETTDTATGEVTFHPGTQLRWLDLVEDMRDFIVDDYETRGKRPPAKEIVQVRAERMAKRKDETLWASYHAQRAQINRLKGWISAKRETISARQSILKGVP